MTELTLEDFKGLKVIHGSYLKFWESIKTNGLSKMNRNHIHFTTQYPEDKPISGMRFSCDLFIEINIPKAFQDGIKFY